MRGLLVACLLTGACYRFPVVGRADLGYDLSVVTDGDLPMPRSDFGLPPSPIMNVQSGPTFTGSTLGFNFNFMQGVKAEGDLLVAVLFTDAGATVTPPDLTWQCSPPATVASMVQAVVCASAQAHQGDASFMFDVTSDGVYGAISEWTPGHLDQPDSSSGKGTTLMLSYQTSVPATGGLVICAYDSLQSAEVNFKTQNPPLWNGGELMFEGIAWIDADYLLLDNGGDGGLTGEDDVTAVGSSATTAWEGVCTTFVP